MVDLNGREAGNGGHSQGTPTAYRDSSLLGEMGIVQQLWRPASEFRLRSPGAKVSNEGLLVFK